MAVFLIKYKKKFAISNDNLLVVHIQLVLVLLINHNLRSRFSLSQNNNLLPLLTKIIKIKKKISHIKPPSQMMVVLLTKMKNKLGLIAISDDD